MHVMFLDETRWDEVLRINLTRTRAARAVAACWCGASRIINVV